MAQQGTGREILIECVQIGAVMRINAIDPETGTEVTFQAPVSTPRTTIQRIAADKLAYVMKRGKG